MFSSRSAANSLAHIESGACPSCPGKENARKQMHNFIANREVSAGLHTPKVYYGLSAYHNTTTIPKLSHCKLQDTRHLLASRPQLGYSGSGRGEVPEYPYQCDKQQCNRRFANPSSLLQHQEYFHKITSRMLAIR